MIILPEFLLLGANTARTKAYLQILARNGFVPGYAVLMAEHPKALLDEAFQFNEREHSETKISKEYFQLDEPVVTTLRNLSIPFEIIPTNSVNEEITINALKSVNSPYVIYSGFGGQILKQPVLSTGKRFLHIHPGIVPEYKGSTTIYYSLIKEGRVGASAIFLEEKIDTGPVLRTKWFDIPRQYPDLDYIYDPYIRATLLAEVINSYVAHGNFEAIEQSKVDGETYYIIHPVLKHIAILSLQD